jgi:ornithine cyclodeaminase
VIHLTDLNGPDVAALAMTDEEILGTVEAGLLAQGRREAVIEPRVHLVPDPAFRGHFNVLRGYLAPLGVAALGHAMLDKARRLGIGQQPRYA